MHSYMVDNGFTPSPKACEDWFSEESLSSVAELYRQRAQAPCGLTYTDAEENEVLHWWEEHAKYLAAKEGAAAAPPNTRPEADQ